MVFTQIIVFFRVVQESVTGKSGEHSGLWKKRGSTIKMGEKQKDMTHKQDYLWGREYYLVRVWPQSRPTLCDSMNCSPLGSSVHRIFQIRLLECVAISFSRVSSQPRDGNFIPCIGSRILYPRATSEALSNPLHRPVLPEVRLGPMGSRLIKSSLSSS